MVMEEIVERLWAKLQRIHSLDMSAAELVDIAYSVGVAEGRLLETVPPGEIGHVLGLLGHRMQAVRPSSPSKQSA